MTDAEFVNKLVNDAHNQKVKPTTQEAVEEVNTILEAIAEALREEGLTKVLVDEKWHVKILDHPGFDHNLMVYDGRIIMTCNGHMKFFELADPKCFTQVAEAVRSWLPISGSIP